MSFNGTEGLQITLEEGAELTARYRSSHPNSTKGMFVGRSHIEAILAQTDCKGLRIYLGENEEGGMELVIVGVNPAENDILDIIVDKMIKCPNNCGIANQLNSTTPSK